MDARDKEPGFRAGRRSEPQAMGAQGRTRLLGPLRRRRRHNSNTMQRTRRALQRLQSRQQPSLVREWVRRQPAPGGGVGAVVSAPRGGQSWVWASKRPRGLPTHPDRPRVSSYLFSACIKNGLMDSTPRARSSWAAGWKESRAARNNTVKAKKAFGGRAMI